MRSRGPVQQREKVSAGIGFGGCWAVPVPCSPRGAVCPRCPQGALCQGGSRWHKRRAANVPRAHGTASAADGAGCVTLPFQDWHHWLLHTQGCATALRVGCSSNQHRHWELWHFAFISVCFHYSLAWLLSGFFNYYLYKINLVTSVDADGRLGCIEDLDII